MPDAFLLLSWKKICAIASAFAAAHDAFVSIDGERQRILMYRRDSVIFQPPKLVITAAAGRRNSPPMVHVVQGYGIPWIAFPSSHPTPPLNTTLLEAWAYSHIAAHASSETKHDAAGAP